MPVGEICSYVAAYHRWVQKFHCSGTLYKDASCGNYSMSRHHTLLITTARLYMFPSLGFYDKMISASWVNTYMGGNFKARRECFMGHGIGRLSLIGR
jgi:hypothetical protein